MIPSIQLSAIQPKGPLMLASDATGAKKLANLILSEYKFYIFQNRSFHSMITDYFAPRSGLYLGIAMKVVVPMLWPA